ncbi:MAG: hypothetical protein ABIR17_12120 [Pseudolysinimonas sp.]|uniref:hypothetical protein n=1 Tax=Pseudolysinimonas sp. TaxID=2680009 RepID=UPI0032647C70
MRDRVRDELGVEVPLDLSRTPTQHFETYSDSKLVADDFTSEATQLLAGYDDYLDDLGLDMVSGLERDADIPPSYNIVDSWDNVAKVGAHLELQEWSKRISRRVTKWINRRSADLDVWQARSDARRRDVDPPQS